MEAVVQANAKATEWSSNNPFIEEWDEHDAWELGLIIYNTKNLGLRINIDGTAADAWKAMNENYSTSSKIAALNAERRLHATELTNGTDFLKHVKDLEEKWSHRVLTDLGMGSENTLTHLTPTSPTIINSSTPGLVTAWQPIVPRAPEGHVHNKLIIDADGDTPDLAVPIPTPVAPISQPLANISCTNHDGLCHSACLGHPTPAIVATRESADREREVRVAHEEWATGETPPVALVADSPYAYLTTFNSYIDNMDAAHIPQDYLKAMRCPDLWQPAIDEELKVMQDRGVFKIVDEATVLEGKNIVGC
ncbi:hypothetical protein H0H87_008452 [Tephrocybe sp. NHM501043]|nr:hypothetical protein H0H87_008452 [Tephrocybe sp. NHM501043]